MAMETGFLQYMIALLKKDYAEELRLLGVTLPNVDKIPTVRFDEAKEKVAEKYHRQIRNPYDLSRRRKHSSDSISKKSMMRISYLLHIIHPRNVRFTRWTIRQIRLIP